MKTLKVEVTLNIEIEINENEIDFTHNDYIESINQNFNESLIDIESIVNSKTLPYINLKHFSVFTK